MLFGGKKAAPKKAAKKAVARKAAPKKAAPKNNAKMGVVGRKGDLKKQNVGDFTLYTAFGGVFAPRDRDIESLANPYDSKLGRRPRPEEYDWRAKVKGGAWNIKQKDRSSTINP